MGRNLFEKRKQQFIELIDKNGGLPRTGEFRFGDGEDMRVWFNTISKLERFKDFINEVNDILEKFGSKVLTDKEKEEEFLNCINEIKHIPMKNEIFFSDNDDMYTWYINYKKRNRDFETIVYINLPEYIDFDLASIWPLVKQEFITSVKAMKRIPNHGEKILQNGIDIRVIFDKLATFDKDFYEKLKLHLETYNKNGLSTEKRISELKEEILTLGYIPEIQESRFSDGTDMFTWYTKYKNIIPDLEDEVNSLLPKVPPKVPYKEPMKVNIYMIPEFKNKEGKFYAIFTNVGEKLDLSEIQSLEDVRKLDSTIEERGQFILNEDEDIDTVSFKKGKTK